MSITLNQAFDSLQRDLRNISNVTLSSKLEWANTANEQIQDAYIQVNPQDCIENHTMQVVSGTSKYARATDFKNRNAPDAGIKVTTSGNDFGILNFDNKTGNFTVDLTVTGTTSGATGSIDEIQDSFLVLSNITGTFQDNEPITDTSTGAATVNGVIVSYDRSKTLAIGTEFGSQSRGYYEEKTNIFITPKPSSNYVLIDRYIPKLTAFTALTNTFLDIPYSEGKYLETITSLLMIRYQLFNRDIAKESDARARADVVLSDFFNTIHTQPRVYTI